MKEIRTKMSIGNDSENMRQNSSSQANIGFN